MLQKGNVGLYGSVVASLGEKRGAGGTSRETAQRSLWLN